MKSGNACGINGYMIREIRRKDCRSRTVLFCYHMKIEHELCFKFIRRRSGYEPTNRADGNLPVEHEDQPDTAAASHAGTRRGKPDRKRPAGDKPDAPRHSATQAYLSEDKTPDRATSRRRGDARYKIPDRSRGCEIMEGGGKAPVHPEEREAAERPGQRGEIHSGMRIPAPPISRI